MAAEDEIRQALEKFYAALNREINGDPGPMLEVWSHGSDVYTMHPLGGINLGWEEVRAGWEQAAQAMSEGQVSLDNPVIMPIAGDVAYTLGTEQGHVNVGGESVRIGWRVTNIFRREGGEWKMVHHHIDVSPAMVDAFDRLEAQ